MPHPNQPTPARNNPRRTLFRMAFLTALATSPATADSPTTTTLCTSVDGHLKYTCEVMLMYDGQPLNGAEIAQRADMPSMPLTHNIPPSRPTENPGRPGHYEFEIELEMHGQWMFTYDLRSPVRDRVHEKILFRAGHDSTSTDHSTHTHTHTTPKSTN